MINIILFVLGVLCSAVIGIVAILLVLSVIATIADTLDGIITRAKERSEKQQAALKARIAARKPIPDDWYKHF